VRGGIWRKPDGAPQFTGDRPGQGFECLAIAHPPGRKRWNGGGKHAVWTHCLEHGHGSGLRNEHPTQKPIGLMLDLVADFTDRGDVVLDPFAGSGTTGVACLRLGRRFVGIERDPTFFALACERLRAEVNGSTVQSSRAGQLPLMGSAQ
jgi:site-specific DNA-methyltransferase (adenine-specific)